MGCFSIGIICKCQTDNNLSSKLNKIHKYMQYCNEVSVSRTIQVSIVQKFVCPRIFFQKLLLFIGNIQVMLILLKSRP